MARTKQTARSLRKPVTTWTRFKLAPSQKWPTWPCPFIGPPTASEMYVGPLAHTPGVDRPSVGRMVDDPSQAVYIIVWDDRKDLETFLASSASVEFLRNLPEVEVDHHGDLQDRGQNEPALESASLSDQSQSPLSPTPPHSRFLVLEDSCEWVSNIEQRVTLTAFLVPRDHLDKESLDSVSQNLRNAFEEALGTDRPCYFEPPGISLWHHVMIWCWGSAAPPGHSDNNLNRLEKTLLGHVQSPLPTKDQESAQGDRQSLVCNFLVWKSFDDPKGYEERFAQDEEFQQEWKEMTEDMKAKGWIRAWKNERWDVRLVPRWEWEGYDDDEEEF